MKNNSLLEDFHAANAIQFGDFKLKSGQISPIYVDLRLLNTSVKIRTKMTNELSKKIKNAGIEFDYLVGVPHGATPLATCIAVAMELPLLTVRKERKSKSYGKQRMIESDYEPGKRVLIIEDVVTSGSSIKETVDKLRTVGLICEHAFCVVNREQGGAQHLQIHGVKLHSLIQISTILASNIVDAEEKQKIAHWLETANTENAVLTRKAASLHLSFAERVDGFSENTLNKRLSKIMLRKCSNLCLAVDYKQTHDIIEIAEKVKGHICALKLHHDIIVDRSLAFFQQLREMANKYEFLLFEDRKYSDTGSTMKMQLEDPISSVAKWADIVTVHGNPGKQSIESAFKPIIESSENQLSGVLLIAELSVNGALNCDVQNVMDLAKGCGPELVGGFICQKQCSNDPKFLHWTPGVNLSATRDGMGQQWRGIQEAIQRDRCDLIIVGRGITAAVDPVAEAKRYKELGWAALMEREGIVHTF